MPRITNELDVSNFSDEFTRMVPADSPAIVPPNFDKIFKVRTSCWPHFALKFWRPFFFPPRNSLLFSQHACWCESVTVDSCGSPQGVAANNNCVLGSSLCNFGTIIAVMNCIQHLQIFGGFQLQKKHVLSVQVIKYCFGYWVLIIWNIIDSDEL